MSGATSNEESRELSCLEGNKGLPSGHQVGNVPSDNYYLEGWIYLGGPRSNSSWSCIYGIGKQYGVNKEEILYEKQVGGNPLGFRVPSVPRYTSRAQNIPLYSPTFANNNRISFVACRKFINVFIKLQDNEHKAVFIFSMCRCKVCYANAPVGEPEKKFDTASVTPLDVELRLANMTRIIKHEHYLKLTFLPGVNGKFDMENEKKVHNYGTVLYYASVPLNSLPTSPFIDFEMGYRPADRLLDATQNQDFGISIQIQSITPAQVSTELLLRDQFFSRFPSNLHSNIEIRSADGRTFFANKAILAYRSPYFKRILENQMDNQVEETNIVMTEDSFATDILLKWIYFYDLHLDRLDFNSLVGTVKLAHMTECMELMGFASKHLLEKLDKMDISSCENNWKDLWNLYNFVHNKNIVQIVVRLKITVVSVLKRLVQETPTLILELTDSAQSAKDFVSDLFRLETRDN